MGCILIVLGIVLNIMRGVSVPLLGVVGVGIVLLGIGLIWNPKEKPDTSHKNIT